MDRLGVAYLGARKQIDLATEQALVAQCRRQDVQAFGKIVDAYQGRVLGFVRRMLRSEEEALDVTQEVFIKAFQSVARFDGRSSLRTWLFRIAHNLCVDRARKAERTPDQHSLDAASEADDAIEFSDSRWSPESLVMNDELSEVVEQALGTMSDKLRTVLLLHDREDMAYEEIAAAVDVPVGTVKSRLFLARAHMQRVVGGYLEMDGRVQ
ncbi:MAG: sigma-70 family RNA polymerase sigma factor [Armatimonadetes bacterium]|nr:sigma-70 family RNA polymerase sigma factor [Armatimonadota bacterium]